MEFVTFLEPSATKNEVAVAKLIETLFTGINTRNLGQLLSIFSESANVESLYWQKVMSVTEYGSAMQEILPIIRFSFLDRIRIQFQGPETASVYGFLSSQLATSSKLYQGEFFAECRKISGNWYIATTRHTPLRGSVNLTSVSLADS